MSTIKEKSEILRSQGSRDDSMDHSEGRTTGPPPAEETGREGLLLGSDS